MRKQLLHLTVIALLAAPLLHGCSYQSQHQMEQPETQFDQGEEIQHSPWFRHMQAQLELVESEWVHHDSLNQSELSQLLTDLCLPDHLLQSELDRALEQQYLTQQEHDQLQMQAQMLLFDLGELVRQQWTHLAEELDPFQSERVLAKMDYQELQDYWGNLNRLINQMEFHQFGFWSEEETAQLLDHLKGLQEQVDLYLQDFKKNQQKLEEKIYSEDHPDEWKSEVVADDADPNERDGALDAEDAEGAESGSAGAAEESAGVTSGNGGNS